MFISRLMWTCWALVPVGLLAYHFGPGQSAYAFDQAARLQAHAAVAEKEAAAAQEAAYAHHLAAIDARRRAFLSQSPDDAAAAREAAATEDAAYKVAAEAWRKAADAFAPIQAILEGTSPDALSRIRWARGRALVRSGDIARGVTDLEDLLDEFAQAGTADSEIATSTREELATAYYYGARLMRLAGIPAEEWRAVSGKARQQFRYLAEKSIAAGTQDQAVRDHEKNLELVLNLEQSSLQDLQGRPLPRLSPRDGAQGLRPGNRPGKTQRPPTRRDGRGAGGAGDIGEGW